jgi:hypothetical protein
MIEALAGPVGLIGLIGLAGLAGLRNPCDKTRAGGVMRLLGLLGFGGLAGFWIPGVGAMGAAGAFSLWNHQSPRLALWGKAAPLSVAGVFYLVRHLLP